MLFPIEMAKSVRVKSGLGGRPKGAGVRHSKSIGEHEVIPEIKTKEIAEEEKEEDDIRETIRQALVANMGNLSIWLTNLGFEDPRSALTAFRDFSEFVLPKLQRTDSNINPSQPLILNMEGVDTYKQRKQQEADGRRNKLDRKGFPDNKAS